MEGISFETRVESIAAYRRMEKERAKSGIEEKQCTLRNDFKAEWALYNDQIVTLLDYLLCSVNLPRRCAVMVFGCKSTRYHGYYTEGNLDLLFAFPVVEKDLQRAVNKLKGRKLLPDTNVSIHCLTFPEYEKFLSGELEYFPDEWKQTGIVLYDFFHRKRLKAEFIKRNR